MLLTMATPRTLPSSDGSDDPRSADHGARGSVSGGPRLRTIKVVRAVPPVDPDSRATDGSSAAPASDASDLASLVIDLTDELRRDRPDLGRTLGRGSRPSEAPQVADDQLACRDMGPEDLATTADLHLSELPHGFFVRFGPRFLAAYHGTFLMGPAATALVVGPGHVPAGFVVGTLDNPRHYRWLVRNAGPMVRAGLGSLTVRPGLALELLRTRAGRYLRSVVRLVRRRWTTAPATADGLSRNGTTPRAVPVVAVLTHVAVAADAQGSGFGRRLVEAFVERVRDHGADEVRLIAHVDTSAPAFYRRLGWHSLGERWSSDGRLVEEFQLIL
jgi:ribosomal protein S18 acetylase RimI-like enzyme